MYIRSNPSTLRQGSGQAPRSTNRRAFRSELVEDSGRALKDDSKSLVVFARHSLGNGGSERKFRKKSNISHKRKLR
jgi:hypothetical protein